MQNFTWINKDTLNIYKTRWINLLAALPNNTLVFLASGDSVYRNNDADYPFRANSNFYYLTGFTEPNAVICLIKNNNDYKSIFFCLPKDETQEIWHGKRCGVENAKKHLEIDACYSIESIESILTLILAQIDNCCFDFNAQYDANHSCFNLIQKLLLKFTSFQRMGHNPPNQLINVNNYISELRLIKDNYEQDIMRKAASISAKAHIKAMQKSKDGLSEYHLEAELLHTFRHYGSESTAYNSIVASGENSCILHHRAGNTILKDKDLCLIDAGCELYGYASDITRTFPVNGKFSKEQALVYEIVLQAQKSAIENAKIGKSFDDIHNAALQTLVQGMLDINLLKKDKYSNLEDAVHSNDYKKFYMHRTSHWLGLDVHDVGRYKEKQPLSNNHLKVNFSDNLDKEMQDLAIKTDSINLQQGMCLTIEPGLYIKPNKDVDEKFWNIGIRIEDDIFIHQNYCEIITREVPVEIYEIEKLMKENKNFL